MTRPCTNVVSSGFSLTIGSNSGQLLSLYMNYESSNEKSLHKDSLFLFLQLCEWNVKYRLQGKGSAKIVILNLAFMPSMKGVIQEFSYLPKKKIQEFSHRWTAEMHEARLV